MLCAPLSGIRNAKRKEEVAVAERKHTKETKKEVGWHCVREIDRVYGGGGGGGAGEGERGKAKDEDVRLLTAVMRG